MHTLDYDICADNRILRCERVEHVSIAKSIPVASRTAPDVLTFALYVFSSSMHICMHMLTIQAKCVHMSSVEGDGSVPLY